MTASYTYHSLETWPHILFFGAIHGDEYCGTQAIFRFKDLIESKTLLLKKWTVTFVPICNPEAYEANKTYISTNLNRCFTKYEDPSIYEHILATTLASYIDACDIFVDLHSTTADWSPNVFQDYVTQASTYLAHATGVEWIIQWRPAVTKSTESDTLKYAESKNKTAVLVECWQHKAVTSSNVAYTVIRNVLSAYGCIDKKSLASIADLPSWSLRTWLSSLTQTCVLMTDIIYKNQDEDCLLKDFTHLQYLHAGIPIARVNNQNYSMPYDGYIIMPKDNAIVGQELFCLGRAV